MNTQGSSSVASEVMNKKRAFHESIITKEAKLKRQKERLSIENNTTTPIDSNSVEEETEELQDERPIGKRSLEQTEELQPAAKRQRAVPKRKKNTNFVDENFFLSSFQSTNSYGEKGYPSELYNSICYYLLLFSSDSRVDCLLKSNVASAQTLFLM